MRQQFASRRADCVAGWRRAAPPPPGGRRRRRGGTRRGAGSRALVPEVRPAPQAAPGLSSSHLSRILPLPGVVCGQQGGSPITDQKGRRHNALILTTPTTFIGQQMARPKLTLQRGTYVQPTFLHSRHAGGWGRAPT